MRQRLRQRLAHLLLCAILVACIGYFATTMSQFHAISDWLVWRYLGYWLLAIVWLASSAALGFRLLRWLLPQDPPKLVFALPLGVFAFHLTIFLLGIVHALHKSSFVWLPLLWLTLGGTEFATLLIDRGRSLGKWSHRDLALAVFGTLCAGLLYFQILTPETFGHDAHWYHLPIAQQYAIDGAVKRWPEGWWLAAYPHLASYLYVWAFQLPFGELFDRYELCAHLEFLVFLATLGGIPSFVRALAPESSGRGSWVAVFLFPGLLLYDSNLNVGADHIAAFWAIPMFLSLLRLWNDWSPRNAILFSVFVAAAALTKYSALNIYGPMLLACALRALYLLLCRDRSRSCTRREALWTASVAAAGAAVLTAPHWLKNWIWYNDPFYPILNRWFQVYPWTPDSPAHYALFEHMLSRKVTDWEGVKRALPQILSFSFEANDWPDFHRDLPVFGSLFTLTFFCLPLIGATRRLWGLFACAMLSVFIWYVISPQARYLQAVLPWMAAAVGAVLTLLWRIRHVGVRVLTCALVGIQLLWGADVPFFPTNNIVGDSTLRHVARFVASGFLKDKDRLRVHGIEGRLGRVLPPDAHVLLHNTYAGGVPNHFVNDLWQGGLDYGALGSPERIHARLKRWGVTHLAWRTNTGLDWTSAAHDMAFANFVLNYVRDAQHVGEFSYAALPRQVPSGPFNSRVAVFSCGRPFATGWYELPMLGDPVPNQPFETPLEPIGSLDDAIRSAGFIVVDPHCSPTLPADLEARFHPKHVRGPLTFYVRRLGA